MSALKGMKYQKRPCRYCGEPTTVRVQLRLRALDPETRREATTLAGRTVTLCDACGFELFADFEERLIAERIGA